MTDFIPDKPFATYEEQIKILESRNLIISPNEKSFVVHSLQIYSYYDLINGNVEKLLEHRHPDRFRNGVTFQQIVLIRVIEDRIKSVCLTQILAIEKTFNTRLSYYIAQNFGVNSADGGYLSKSNYSSSRTNLVKKTMKRLRGVRDHSNIKRKESDSLTYYRNNHNHIPPWILINDLMFGESIYWYKSLKSDGKFIISSQLISIKITERELLLATVAQTLDVLRDFRNFFAHNSVLSQMKSDRKLNNKDIYLALDDDDIFTANELDEETSNGLYACLLSILFLSTDPDQLQFFALNIEQILNSIDENDQQLIFNEIFGLPVDFLKKIELFIKKIANQN